MTLQVFVQSPSIAVLPTLQSHRLYSPHPSWPLAQKGRPVQNQYRAIPWQIDKADDEDIMRSFSASSLGPAQRRKRHVVYQPSIGHDSILFTWMHRGDRSEIATTAARAVEHNFFFDCRRSLVIGCFCLGVQGRVNCGGEAREKDFSRSLRVGCLIVNTKVF